MITNKKEPRFIKWMTVIVQGQEGRNVNILVKVSDTNVNYCNIT